MARKRRAEGSPSSDPPRARPSPPSSAPGAAQKQQQQLGLLEEQMTSSGEGSSGHGSPAKEAVTTSQPSKGKKVPWSERPRPAKPKGPPCPCPRCSSANTKFCYYNNHVITQPRYFCKACQRYWTEGGALRDVPVGAGRRKPKQAASSSERSSASGLSSQTQTGGGSAARLRPSLSDTSEPSLQSARLPSFGTPQGTPQGLASQQDLQQQQQQTALAGGVGAGAGAAAAPPKGVPGGGALAPSGGLEVSLAAMYPHLAFTAAAPKDLAASTAAQQVSLQNLTYPTGSLHELALQQRSSSTDSTGLGGCLTPAPGLTPFPLLLLPNRLPSALSDPFLGATAAAAPQGGAPAKPLGGGSGQGTSSSSAGGGGGGLGAGVSGGIPSGPAMASPLGDRLLPDDLGFDLGVRAPVTQQDWLSVAAVAGQQAWQAQQAYHATAVQSALWGGYGAWNAPVVAFPPSAYGASDWATGGAPQGGTSTSLPSFLPSQAQGQVTSNPCSS